MALYAAYGSNLDPARMVERCPHSPFRGTGWLVGWRLTFAGEDTGGTARMATIVEDPDAQVFVCLYDVTAEDERELDGWEIDAVPKVKVRVQTLEGEQLAWLYVLDAYEGGLPSASYLERDQRGGRSPPAPRTTTSTTCGTGPAAPCPSSPRRARAHRHGARALASGR